MVNELTESALFLLNLTYDYKDLQCRKATAGASVAFVKQKLQKQQQNKATTSVRRRRLSTEDPDDDPEAEGTSSAASKPTKKRLVDSDVVVVARDPPSKRSRKASTSEKVRNEEPIDFQYSCHYGGLEDEDDYWQEEREAIGRCPDKEPGARILSDRALMKVRSSAKTKKCAKVSEWRTGDLPVDAIGQWRKTFIPTYAAYIGTKRSPWDIKDNESIEVMQDCWNHVYRRSTTAVAEYRISGIHDVVFSLGDQRWKELRNTIARAAIGALDMHFVDVGANTNLERHDEAVKLSININWLYGTVTRREHDGKITYIGQAFYGPLVLKTFGAFLKWTKSRDDSWKMIKDKSPVGALGLATAAVERAVGFWANLPVSDDQEAAKQSTVKLYSKNKGKSAKGVPFGKIDVFSSDKWGNATKGWITGALGKGLDSMEIMQPLIDKAKQAVAEAKSNATTRNRDRTIAPSDDWRCNLVEGVISDSE